MSFARSGQVADSVEVDMFHYWVDAQNVRMLLRGNDFFPQGSEISIYLPLAVGCTPLDLPLGCDFYNILFYPFEEFWNHQVLNTSEFLQSIL